MPFRVTIGKKPPKFDRDLPSYNITVKGPRHLFTEKVENWLFTQGLNRLDSSGTLETWSTRYNIGAPALYMAAYIDRKYGAILDHDTKALVSKAIGLHQPDDGIEAFTGRGAPTPAGNKPLFILSGSSDFIANCSADNKARRDFLQGAGWIPIVNPSPKIVAAFGTQPYLTRDPLIASNLEHFMTDGVKARLRERLAVFMRNISRSKSHKAPEGFNIPSPENLDYLPFQKGGIGMVLEQGKGAIIADDMGLGKTIQGIGILNGKADVKRAIYICQANMRLKWVQEIEKWKTNPDLTVAHAEGDDFPDTDIVVINYDIAARHIEKIRAIKWDLIIPDEAHNMKNEEAKRTQAILGTVNKDGADADFIDMIPLAPNGMIVHLTGTPKPNKVSELWPLLTSSRPDVWGKGPEARQAFLDRYEPPVLIRKMMRRGTREYPIIVPLAGKPIREAELQMRLRGSGSFIRRLKRDTDLPPKFRTPIPLPFTLTAQDQDALKQTEQEFAELQHRINALMAKDITPGRSRKATELIDTIAGAPPKSAEFHEIARIRANLGVLKAPLAARFIIDELKDDEELAIEDRRKTVVFAHHKQVVSIIAALAEAEMPGSVLVYDGSITSAKKRQDIIDKFQDDPKKRIIIITLSGATGITLTAAHRMRVVEPDWSPSNMVQIEDRIWRIGQEQNCDIGYLFVPNSMDITVGMGLIRKMETDERAINTISKRGLKARQEDDNALDGFGASKAPPRAPKVVDTAQNEFLF